MIQCSHISEYGYAQFAMPVPLIRPRAPVVLAPHPLYPVREILAGDRFVLPLT